MPAENPGMKTPNAPEMSGTSAPQAPIGRPAELEQMLAGLPCAVFRCRFDAVDAAPYFSFLSPGIRQLTGLDAGFVVNNPLTAFLSVVAPQDVGPLETGMRAALAAGQEWKAQFRVNVAGQMRWISGHATIAQQQDGSVQADGYLLDATEFKRLECENREARERFDRLFQAAPQPISISDARGNITAWNLACTGLFGYTHADMPTLSDCFQKLFPDPEQRARALQHWATTVQETERTGRPSKPVSFRGRAKDGSECIAEIRTATAGGENIAFFVDVTERSKSAERARLWASILEHSDEGIMICDAQCRMLMVNPAFVRLTGYAEHEVIGKTPAILKSGLHVGAFYSSMWGSLNTSGSWSGEIRNRRKHGETFTEWLSISAVRGESGVPTHYVGIFSDITQRKESERKLEYMAHHDALTSLPNRALLMDRLQQLIDGAGQEALQIGVLFLDLDRFKGVNESMGHDAGDILLNTVADRLRKAMRAGDTVARVSGDEFIILAPQLRSAKDAASIAQKILSVLPQPMTIRGEEISITGSIGIAVFPDDGATVRDLLRNADAAMYQAKTTGRNTLRFYTRDMNERALQVLSLENGLRGALDRGEFCLHYQPQVSIATGAVIGLEALIRWNRPGHGLVPPGQFIPIAEESGLIVDIGGWVIEDACRQIRRWELEGLPAIPVAVNLSSLQFHQDDFADRLIDVVQRMGVQRNRLELELTESLMIGNAEGTIAVLHRLKDNGLRLSIDDFGTGYSSLNYLRRLPIDKIKIDQSFVREMAGHTGTRRVVRGIIGLAKSLGLDIIAEGVETQEQLALLQIAGCDEAQGFLFSAAVPPEQVATFFGAHPFGVDRSTLDPATTATSPPDR
jgi:diguanylate cyclase (GGDEF)-like protein/PAS domain S-box-containing protein